EEPGLRGDGRRGQDGEGVARLGGGRADHGREQAGGQDQAGAPGRAWARPLHAGSSRSTMARLAIVGGPGPPSKHLGHGKVAAMGRLGLAILVLVSLAAGPAAAESDALTRPLVMHDSPTLPIPPAALSEAAR